jgi:hypothetical protein
VIEQTELTLETADAINESVLDSIGLRLPCNNTKLKCPWKGKRKNDNIILDHAVNKTIFRIDTITDEEVKEFTGFPSLSAMIAFIVILSGGDIDQMIVTCSDLNWLEEWLLFFERLWGKSFTRWVDCRRKYSISSRCCRKVFDSKLSINMKSRRLYPRFVSLQEDLRLRKEKWNETYGNERRIIMWDNTDITMFKPSQSEAQRLTYSQYYA